MRHLLCALLLALCAVPAAFGQDADAPARAAVYVVKKGDTLYSIARRNGLSVEQLQRLNGLTSTTIRPGQELTVRTPAGDDAAAAPPPPGTLSPPPEDAPPPERPSSAPAEATPAASGAPFYGSYTAEAGDTFYTIAARYGTSVDSLAALNDSTGTFLRPGQAVRLPASLGPPTHTVAAGESIYDVARQYSVSVKLLQYTNDLQSKQLIEGQRLRIPGRSAPAPQPPGTRPPVRTTGPVARYPASFEGRLMAGSRPYDPQRFTVSHPSLPLGTVVLLTDPATGRHAFAEVADRGPLDEKYVMDVSAAVFERLGLAGGSEQPIEVRVMD